MFAHGRDGDPWSRAVIISVERWRKVPGIYYNQIVRRGFLFEFVRDDVDVGESLMRDVPKLERQKRESCHYEENSRNSKPLNARQ